MVEECCKGCKWQEEVKTSEGDIVEKDEYGYSNPFIDSEWCLNPYRLSIKGYI